MDSETKDFLILTACALGIVACVIIAPLPSIVAFTVSVIAILATGYFKK